MPPRKSTASNPPDDGAEPTPAPAKAHKEKDGLGVEDLTLPKSMIARLAKGVLPANTQIQKDALLAMHKSATVFVSYIASNSNDLARMGGKKTISPQDVMSALKDAELEGFLPRLEAELKKYNDTQCDKRNSYRHRVKAEKAAAAGGAAGEALDATDASLLAAQLNGVADGQEGAEGEGGERPAKKFKGEGGTVVITPGEPVDDADVEEMEEEDGDEGEDGEDEEEGDDDEGEEDDEDGADEAMEGVEGGEMDGRGGMRDEALDDGNESD
ncbi:hypothetical protein WHR41_03996 [Cladosporium halotolerans]|uniref:DNA polymerase epsilon subunit D n=1 Tax=Cladosporium halotolerans TaxID=1052096 RepID=A0AB34KTM8_9PEZI